MLVRLHSPFPWTSETADTLQERTEDRNRCSNWPGSACSIRAVHPAGRQRHNQPWTMSTSRLFHSHNCFVFQLHTSACGCQQTGKVHWRTVFAKLAIACGKTPEEEGLFWKVLVWVSKSWTKLVSKNVLQQKIIKNQKESKCQWKY